MGLNLRRRTMVEGGSVSPLPADCVFYAPLTQNDTTDHVSGTAATIEAGQAAWDATTQMWRLVANSPKTGVLQYNFSAPILNLYNQDCTVVLDMAEEQSNGNNWFAPIKVGKQNFTTYPAQFYLAHIFFYSNTTPRPNLTRYATIWHSATQRCDSYVNGTQTDANRQRSLSTGDADCITLCFLPANNSLYTIRIKNVYVFNRALTPAEIAAL